MSRVTPVLCRGWLRRVWPALAVGLVGVLGGVGVAGAATVTEFPIGVFPDEPAAAEIAAGPDGNLWFTEPLDSRVGRITPRGMVTEFSAGITSTPGGIAAGPDRNLWFTERDRGRVGRITPAGRVTEFSAGITPRSWPWRIAAGRLARATRRRITTIARAISTGGDAHRNLTLTINR